MGSAIERLSEKVALAIQVKAYLKRSPTGHIEPVVAHERTGQPAAPPGITPLKPLGPPPPGAVAPIPTSPPAPARKAPVPSTTPSKRKPGPLTDAEFKEKYGQDRPKDGVGDCFDASFKTMEDIAADPDKDISEYRYVVGVPTGQGPIEGVKYDHAWVEHTTHLDAPKEATDAWKKQGVSQEQIDSMLTITNVIDNANGNHIETLAQMYYALGQIDANEVTRYTYDEMMANAERTGYLGVWAGN
jgi:hypothetical protein